MKPIMIVEKNTKERCDECGRHLNVSANPAFTRFDIINKDIPHIQFDCIGAIDYKESLNIELSLDYKEGYIESDLFQFWSEIQIPLIRGILLSEFKRLIGKTPDFRDTKSSVYYKIYRLYKHSHEAYDKKPTETIFSIKELKEHLKKGFEINIDKL